MSPITTEREFFETFFNALRRRKIDYCVLRNFERLPESTGSRDVDIMISSRKSIHKLDVLFVEEFARGNIRFFRRYKDERIFQYFLGVFIDGEFLFEVKLDFFWNIEVYGVPFVTGGEVVDASAYRGDIRVARGDHIVLDKLLFHAGIGESVDPKYDDVFCRYANDNLKKSLVLFFGWADGCQRYKSIVDKNVSMIPLESRFQRLSLMFRGIGRRPLTGLVGFFGFCLYQLIGFYRFGGLWISFSGPDGCGKTTLLDQVNSQLFKWYGENIVRQYHFRPKALPRIADIFSKIISNTSVDDDFHNPHRARPSGPFLSTVRLLWFWADYIFGYVLYILPRLRKREVIIFDRYVFDLIADPNRCRISLPQSVLNFLLRITPIPAYSFFIEVPADLVFQRKTELSEREILRQNNVYSDLAHGKFLIPIPNKAEAEDAVVHICDVLSKAEDRRIRLMMEVNL